MVPVVWKVKRPPRDTSSGSSQVSWGGREQPPISAVSVCPLQLLSAMSPQSSGSRELTRGLESSQSPPIQQPPPPSGPASVTPPSPHSEARQRMSGSPSRSKSRGAWTQRLVSSSQRSMVQV